MITTEDFLQFWAEAIPSLQVHPADAVMLESNRHKFALDTLVGPFMGPVCTAPVVLLALNPGLVGGEEQAEANILEVREQMAHNLGGEAPLPTFKTNPAGRKWTEGRLAQFAVRYEPAASKVAFVNLMPYRSRNGSDDISLSEHLKSCRQVKAWARDTLFPEAEAGRRVVVCLRSARLWGLEPGNQRGISLFAPKVTRGGFMHHNAMREAIGLAVRPAVYQ
jgi:hypothetical protein